MCVCVLASCLHQPRSMLFYLDLRGKITVSLVFVGNLVSDPIYGLVLLRVKRGDKTG